MNIQSWMIKSWATHEWYLPPEADMLPRFLHVSTQIRDEDAASGLRAGDTVWLAQEEDWQVGLAWEWVEVKPGLVMLADPNSIITNLQLVDSQKRNVVGLARTVAINRLVHAMTWQQPVCKLLTGPRHSAKDEALACDTRAHLSHMQLLQKHTKPLPSARLLSVPAQQTAEAADKRPAAVQSAVVHMAPQATHGPGLRSRNPGADREDGALAAGARPLRRAA